MKNISQWAKLHQRSARSLVAILKFLLAVMAVYTGLSFSQMDIHLSIWMIYLAVPVVFVTAVYYPSKESSPISKDHLYIRRKTSDFILGACSFVSICTCINNIDVFESPVSRSFGSTSLKKINPPSPQEILSSLSTRDKKSLTHQERRVLKKEFNKQLQLYVKSKLAGDEDKSGNALLVILTIIGAVGLLFLLSALVCSLSCNGSDAAAILVGLLGLAGIIWGAIAIIKAINKPKTKEDTAPSQ